MGILQVVVRQTANLLDRGIADSNTSGMWDRVFPCTSLRKHSLPPEDQLSREVIFIPVEAYRRTRPVGPSRTADPVDEREKRQLQNEVEQEGNEDNDEDTSSKPPRHPLSGIADSLKIVSSSV
jgi:hypothetical protein